MHIDIKSSFFEKAALLKKRTRCILFVSISIIICTLFLFYYQYLIPVGYPLAEKGVLDLMGWDFNRSGIVKLNGEWDFYWQQLLRPEDFVEKMPVRTGFMDLPRPWNGYVVQHRELSGDGYATFRLKIKANESQLLALRLPKMATAYKLWINNQLLASNGKVGTSEKEMVPQYLPQVIIFEPDDRVLQVVIQTSNFMHQRGGIWENIELGTEKQVRALRDRRLALELLLVGCILAVGINYMSLCMFQKREKSYLVFGIFCVLLGLRALFIGEMIIFRLFPSINWEIALKIEYLAYYLSLPLVLLFFSLLFPQEFSQKFCRIIYVLGGVFSVLVLITPARIFTSINIIYQILTVVAIVCSLCALAAATARKREGAFVILVGGALFGLTIIGDILYFNNNTYFIKKLISWDQLSSPGLLMLIFSQSFVLSRKFSNSFFEMEEASNKLRELNENLEIMVQERTEALRRSNEKILQQKINLQKANKMLRYLSTIDELTNIANRRYFNQALHEEWRRSMRDGRPLSLIFVDVDYFKNFNDYYGHQAGDQILIQVATVINNTLHRAGDFVARYGGEEFIVVLPNTSGEQAFIIAETIRLKIEDLKIPHDRSAVAKYVTASFGVAAAIPDKAAQPGDLLSLADRALYQAKEAGRNIVKIIPSPGF
jgi:diguanylate cyclase (GGDEF)-like protein